jgi:hypothetical protein
LYPLSLRLNSVVCPQEPLVKLGVPGVIKGCGALLYGSRTSRHLVASRRNWWREWWICAALCLNLLYRPLSSSSMRRYPSVARDCTGSSSIIIYFRVVSKTLSLMPHVTVV